MNVCWARPLACLLLAGSAAGAAQLGQSQSQSQSSSSSKHAKSSSARLGSDIAAGAVANGIYRNRALALACKIPAGWVLRTEEMNAREEDANGESQSGAKSSPQQTQGSTGENGGGRVL